MHSEAGAQNCSKSTPWGTFRPGPRSTPVNGGRDRTPMLETRKLLSNRKQEGPCFKTAFKLDRVSFSTPEKPLKLTKVGCTKRESCNTALLRRVLRRFSNNKCFLEGFLEGACKGFSVKASFFEGFLEGSILWMALRGCLEGGNTSFRGVRPLSRAHYKGSPSLPEPTQMA